MTDPAPDPTPAQTASPGEPYDLTIIGAGPVGLFGAFYAGLRGMRTLILDSLPEPGGQLAALYPDKFIFDVGGFPRVVARDLVAALMEQALQFHPTLLLDEEATGLEATPGGYRLLTGRGRALTTKTLLITGGVGAFVPRRLDRPEYARFEGHGLHYVLPGLSPFAGRRVLLLGGGDTAVDWALHLEPIAKELTLIHRRDRFRAHEDSVRRLSASRTRVLAFHELKAIEGSGHVERAVVFDNRSNEETTLDVEEIVVNFGMVADLGPIKTWGLQIRGNSILANQKMETNLAGVYAAGDIVAFPGKLKLIATGFGEAATAVCTAKMLIDPTARYFPGHSSEMTVFEEAQRPGSAESRR
jgi:thioredoxin reductase (NADPH)